MNLRSIPKRMRGSMSGELYKARIPSSSEKAREHFEAIDEWLVANPELAKSYINHYNRIEGKKPMVIVVFNDPTAAIMLKLAIQP